MDFRKAAIILGGLIGALILFFIVKAVFFKDEAKPLLGNLITLNQQLIELSQEASDQLVDFNSSQLAANIVTTLSSDNLALTKYYQSHYGKKITANVSSNKQRLESLKAASGPDAYNQTYLDLTNQLRQTAQNQAELLQAQANSELNQLVRAYQQHLEILFAQ